MNSPSSMGSGVLNHLLPTRRNKIVAAWRGASSSTFLEKAAAILGMRAATRTIFRTLLSRVAWRRRRKARAAHGRTDDRFQDNLTQK